MVIMHNIEWRSYPIKRSQNSITKELDTYVRAQTYQEGGRLDKIRWLPGVKPDELSAREYLRQQDRGWYDNLAVQYKEPNPDTGRSRRRWLVKIEYHT